MNEYYVYQLRRSDSLLPFYVGKGKGERATAHFHPSRLKTRSWKNSAIKSAIADGVTVLTEKLMTGLTEDEALTEEKLVIAKYGRRQNGTGCLTNMTDGGEGTSGRVLTKESRAAISARNLLLRHTPESKAKISKALVGRLCSEHTRQKMSQSRKGKPIHNAETKARIAAGNAALPMVTCTHCGKTMRKQQAVQWHGDNCKMKGGEQCA